MNTEAAVIIRTAVVDGPLAYQMRRAAPARANECGLQILTLPQLAARLAGRLTAPVTAERLEPAIREAPDQGGFSELEHVRRLPGMTRAVAQTLARAWNAEIDFGRIGDAKPGRIHDLALIEDRVKAQLPQAILMPRALRDLALTRMQCSRHWHDLVRLNDASYAREAFDDRGLAKEVAEFKGKFFRARDSKGNPIDYVAAVAGALNWFLMPRSSRRSKRTTRKWPTTASFWETPSPSLTSLSAAPI